MLNNFCVVSNPITLPPINTKKATDSVDSKFEEKFHWFIGEDEIRAKITLDVLQNHPLLGLMLIWVHQHRSGIRDYIWALERLKLVEIS